MHSYIWKLILFSNYKTATIVQNWKIMEWNVLGAALVLWISIMQNAIAIFNWNAIARVKKLCWVDWSISLSNLMLGAPSQRKANLLRGTTLVVRAVGVRQSGSHPVGMLTTVCAIIKGRRLMSVNAIKYNKTPLYVDTTAFIYWKMGSYQFQHSHNANQLCS